MPVLMLIAWRHGLFGAGATTLITVVAVLVLHHVTDGIGARLDWRSLQLKLDVAHALKDAISTGNGDTRVHFLAIYTFP